MTSTYTFPDHVGVCIEDVEPGGCVWFGPGGAVVGKGAGGKGVGGVGAGDVVDGDLALFNARAPPGGE